MRCWRAAAYWRQRHLRPAVGRLRPPVRGQAAWVDTPGKKAVYNNLGENEELALQIDAGVKSSRPDDWRGVEAKERTIKAAMYAVLHDEETVERLFLTIKNQREY